MATLFLGAVPERQPWRVMVQALYAVAIGLVLLVGALLLIAQLI